MLHLIWVTIKIYIEVIMLLSLVGWLYDRIFIARSLPFNLHCLLELCSYIVVGVFAPHFIFAVMKEWIADIRYGR